jgi:glucokinase
MQFISDSKCEEKVQIVVCGIPGDVIQNRVDAINIPHWGRIDGTEAARVLGVSAVILLNDFECAAYALNGLNSKDFHCIREGKCPTGTVKAMVGLGTGLGVAFANQIGEFTQPCPSEAGWIPFWEISNEERDMAKHLRESLGVDTLSFEHVCSGPALVRLAGYVATQTGSKVFYSSPKEISENYNNCNVAQASVKLMGRFLGRFLAVLSLVYKPTGGIYLTGGTMDSLAPLIELSDSFTSGLDSHKHPILLNISKSPSVYIITRKDVGMWGAREYALIQGKGHQ